jgi:membrane-associated protease RseP (regulator of RpoE activity)
LQFDFLLPLLPFLPWLIILVAWGILFAASTQLKKHGVEVGPFMVMVRTKRFNNLLDRIGRWHPRAWRYLYSGFVAVCFAFAVLGLYLLCLNLWLFILKLLQALGLISPSVPANPGAVVVLLPGITISFTTFFELLIPLAIVIVFHELAHGVAARADDIPVKSSGVFAFFVLPGAFVEPDEEYIKVKATRKARVRLYAAGSGANLALALVPIFLAFLLVFHVPQGVLITGIIPGGPAEGILTPLTVITGMNETAINTADDLSAFMNTTHPGDFVQFTVNGASVNLTLGANPQNASRGYIGIYLTDNYPLVVPLNLLGPPFGYEFQRELGWFLLIALGIGIMNLLPTPPFDGDKLFKELIDATISLDRSSGRAVLWALRGFALALLVLNLVFTFLNPSLLAMFLG